MPRPEPTPEQREWEKSISPAITSDIIWGLDAYRAALFLLDCVQRDLESIKARADVRDQLLRASGDVGAAIGEGYSRATRADRVRFYGYALGSIRECAVWYLGLRDKLSAETLEMRLTLVARCRALLLGMIGSSRTNTFPKRSENDRRARPFEP